MEAIGSLQPIWDEFYPAEHNRILRLLVERIDVAADGSSITLHTAGIRSLATELTQDGVPRSTDMRGPRHER